MSGLAWAGIAVVAIIVLLAVIAGRRKSGINQERPHTAEELVPARMLGHTSADGTGPL